MHNALCVKSYEKLCVCQSRKKTSQRKRETVWSPKNIIVLLRIINPWGWAGINCRTDCKQFTTLIAAEMREPSWENLSDDGRKGKRYRYLSLPYLASSFLWSADLNLRFTAQLIPQGELHFLLRRGKERDLRMARFPESRKNLATGQRRGERKERKEIRREG